MAIAYGGQGITQYYCDCSSFIPQGPEAQVVFRLPEAVSNTECQPQLFSIDASICLGKHGMRLSLRAAVILNMYKLLHQGQAAHLSWLHCVFQLLYGSIGIHRPESKSVLLGGVIGPYVKFQEGFRR